VAHVQEVEVAIGKDDGLALILEPFLDGEQLCQRNDLPQ
jgi:hypothetical protein